MRDECRVSEGRVKEDPMEGRGLGKWGQRTARWVSMVSMAGLDKSHELTHAQAPLIMLTQSGKHGRQSHVQNPPLRDAVDELHTNIVHMPNGLSYRRARVFMAKNILCNQGVQVCTTEAHVSS